jgi:hypothetical protein
LKGRKSNILVEAKDIVEDLSWAKPQQQWVLGSWCGIYKSLNADQTQSKYRML